MVKIDFLIPVKTALSKFSVMFDAGHEKDEDKLTKGKDPLKGT